MRAFDFSALANTLLPAVLAAGAAQMRYFADGVSVETKADTSPVTAADRESEALLLDGLWHAARGVPVIAEESMSLGQSPPRGTAFFLVDPLDGTREFVNRRPEFTVNIGLVVGSKPVFGLIYAPALGELFVTLGGGRAVSAEIPVTAGSANLPDRELRDLHTRAPDLAALTVIESQSHRTAETEAFLKGYAVADVQRSGSSLKFCRIAQGRGDFYARLGPTCEWDTAAGQAILEAAGGSVTDLAWTPLTYGKSNASYKNPHFVAWARTPIAPRADS
jgi:3'(2'), 5'-bisphosphate nucleotidase